MSQTFGFLKFVTSMQQKMKFQRWQLRFATSWQTEYIQLSSWHRSCQTENISWQRSVSLLISKYISPAGVIHSRRACPFPLPFCADFFLSNPQHSVPDNGHDSSAAAKYGTFCRAPENLSFCFIPYSYRVPKNLLFRSLSAVFRSNFCIFCRFRRDRGHCGKACRSQLAQ